MMQGPETEEKRKEERVTGIRVRGSRFRVGAFMGLQVYWAYKFRRGYQQEGI
jgi:hypothetical protein